MPKPLIQNFVDILYKFAWYPQRRETIFYDNN